MDSGHYDFVGAKRRLDDLIEQRQHLCTQNSMLAGVAQVQWPVDVKVLELGVPKVHRLVTLENGDAQELVFRLPGILIAKELPPIERPMGKNTKARYLKQSVTITGFGNDAFSQAVQGLGILDAAFGRWLGTENIQPNTIVGTFRGHATIEASNRYFTPALVARTGDEPAIVLDHQVDPKGILKALASDEYVHLSENQVIYTSVVKTESGKERNVPFHPRSFQLGDIVEILVSLLGVKIDMRNGKYRMVCTLRAISLLDGSFSELASVMKHEVLNRELLATPRLKRTLDLSGDEEDNKRMREE
ncbi:hypothetical protein VNI00_018776 [Paramarasmius palmivorus]|uniref:Uncharacterized protein n=1 Tax=Paramarasmius palmivorus TaxID=297713 RepID=A0AAW0AUZ3_9AGAR